MFKFDGGVRSSRYSSPGVLGFFFTVGRLIWLRGASEASNRHLNGLKVSLKRHRLESLEIGSLVAWYLWVRRPSPNSHDISNSTLMLNTCRIACDYAVTVLQTLAVESVLTLAVLVKIFSITTPFLPTTCQLAQTPWWTKTRSRTSPPISKSRYPRLHSGRHF